MKGLSSRRLNSLMDGFHIFLIHININYTLILYLSLSYSYTDIMCSGVCIIKDASQPA